MTQVDFASRDGVSKSYLAAVEHGRNEVGAEVLLAISREFGRSMEWLLTGVRTDTPLVRRLHHLQVIP